jgi:hypothetical protein
MKNVLVMLAFAALLSACSASGQVGQRPGIEPIPGSITYGGQPATRLTKAPVGSVVPHQFRNELGQRVTETYIIQPDRSLRLVSRQVCRSPFCDD